jgi:hypothetical protein
MHVVECNIPPVCCPSSACTVYILQWWVLSMEATHSNNTWGEPGVPAWSWLRTWSFLSMKWHRVDCGVMFSFGHSAVSYCT